MVDLVALEDDAADQLIIAEPCWNDLQIKVQKLVNDYHNQFPLRRGMPREELKSRLKLSPRVFNAIIKRLSALQLLSETGISVAKPGREIHFDNGQQAQVQTLMQEVRTKSICSTNRQRMQSRGRRGNLSTP